MKHIMLDLETLSSDSDAAVVQIGAVVFDMRGVTDTTFKATIDVEDAMRFGKVSPSTLKWWMSQGDAARASVMGGSMTLAMALNQFNFFVQEQGDCYFWAHATFDFPVLMNAYKAAGVKMVLPYRKMLDMRTLELHFGDCIGEWQKREGTHHDALDDAIWQAKHAAQMLSVADTMLQRWKDD